LLATKLKLVFKVNGAGVKIALKHVPHVFHPNKVVPLPITIHNTSFQFRSQKDKTKCFYVIALSAWKDFQKTR